MFFSWFSYEPDQPSDHHGAAPFDDSDHSVVVLITFGVFFFFIILYLVAGVVWASVVTACAVALAAVYLKLRRRRHAAALRRVVRSSGGDGRTEDDDIVVSAVLPAFAYKREGDGATGWAQCVICLGMVQVGEMVRRLPACKHLFHVECIDMWLRSHTTCPICRAVVEPTATGRWEPPV
ncbi:hypothetical protein PR202_gb24515 [Eleusine coracana subsp. coracana]|uniref:RING-type E3 ubiquitin transferase n=1 Tax=Eleusine coracana subsp. coracana TaxID=191504 RepID=A0AAV5FM82_ELECO|nr:hypothetical protein QOZ80_5BG0449280 [Eleusine coracana subsp. coracana]GJN35712.1 hypothetical protein PR202_gb24515 [Eleusine coracana subsp. coracana]